LRTYYSDQFTVPLPDYHRFPIEKYARLRNRILERCIVRQQDLHIPNPARDEQIILAHHPRYLNRVVSGSLSEKEVRRIGFPWSPELVERSRRSVGGTIAACRSAIESGIAVNLAGGTHHAHPDFGSGYCLLNDCAIAARVIQSEGAAKKIVIIDCDVHQGDGSAAIFSSDASVFTFSIHGARNFPFRKQNSDLDLPMEDGAGDQEYLLALESALNHISIKFQADLAIYLAGADPFKDDRLGRLSLTKAGLAERDWLVLEHYQRKDIPLAIVMAGGYANQIGDTVDIHANTIALAAQSIK
jgi:acetoin utilization deacetylase AcuC-like enzyme